MNSFQHIKRWAVLPASKAFGLGQKNTTLAWHQSPIDEQNLAAKCINNTHNL